MYDFLCVFHMWFDVIPSDLFTPSDVIPSLPHVMSFLVTCLPRVMSFLKKTNP